mgnify:CR=1 FL=1
MITRLLAAFVLLALFVRPATAQVDIMAPFNMDSSMDDAAVLAELKELNAAYEDRFGHVYLVFANGRPAAELLAILKERIRNDPATERRVMRAELAKINRSRLIRMLTPAGGLNEEGAAS